MAEPFYSCCAGRESLKALCFWYQVCALHPVIRRDAPVAVVPSRATVAALGLHFLELGEAHGRLGTQACGIDHAPLDQLWAGCREQPMCFHLWSYAHEVVSEAPLPLLCLNYEACAAAAAPLSTPSARRVCMPLQRGTTRLDAIAIRVE